MKNVVSALLAILLIAAPYSYSAHERSNPSIEFYGSDQPGLSELPFSEAVRVGDLLFLSGQIGTSAQTGKLVPGGIKAEATQTMENIKATLNRQGYKLGDVVKCTVMLADIAQWQIFNEVYVSYFSKPYPARSAFGANGLALNARLEVECIAAK